ncbi:MAG: hypothetical protein CBC22_06870 [Alphaproteobacteria bacterium TMED62]|nr:MAG: hypothetical protein CBC22_06870 [Alphaproteobacteria bacterium TMED62]|tara:strand:- start:18194 stop:18811 length:618 start_codon:yes stop_codon:yes gene_type:complete
MIINKINIKKNLINNFNEKQCYNLYKNKIDVVDNYKNYTKSSVLCLLMYNNMNTSSNIILTKRSKDLKHHAGQISLPGGKLDIKDKGDFINCAFREAREEIGFESKNANYYGKLNKYITGSGFLIQPIVAIAKGNQNFILNKHEVTSILHLPINFLLSDNVMSKVFYNNKDKNKFYISFTWKNNRIWGATAKILLDLVNLLKVNR